MSSNPVRQTCSHPHHCSTDVRMRVMARSPLTRDLTPEQHTELDTHLRAVAWAEGEPLMMAGETPGGVHLVMSGRVRVTRDTVDGEEITLDIAGPGDVIGPLDTAPVPVEDSAWAMETTCALFLRAETLGEVVATFPPLAMALLQLQQQRLTAGREREVAQSTRTVEQRVAGVLLQMAGRLGQSRPDGSVLLQVRLRRDDIAGMAATTVESASRAMAKMKRNGLIDSGREWVVILDAAGLADL
ncbi:Crp/Fnr family transcriptional regulator [Corynebacterium marinum]|uniref:Transcriptional regulator n=1 Tax=Corynebacterium marinum DSM 44953 TaxID=1224162 RepID=A0A0B6TY41_9CORY|nr:Crp/Fnr family transcriptional regulator [Corynebacterium marinum]AJK69641.1 transcriptional regulator [Corynebacterium marinum DSM 44953]GGO22805.1 catabolite gene activator [Corynebacterium marinum]